MKKVYYIKEDKAAVQDFYADVIGKGLEIAGFPKYNTISVSEINGINKDSIIICISHYLTVKMWIKGFKNLIYWVQGSSPDESFMRNHSYIRKFIISAIEKIALEKCKFCFMVSNSLIEHYKAKYQKDYSYKSYVMPCYNTEIKKEFFMHKNKYVGNKFCYVGGLSVWQNFPETVDLFKEIQNKLPNASFKVLTGDKEKAIKILEEKGIKDFEVNHVAPDKLAEEISDCKFGFIVRSKSPVNYVATPTKLSNYMGAGLIPVVSDTVGFFDEILSDSHYSVLLTGDTERDVNNILSIAKDNICAEDVYREFELLFHKFYNTEEHTNKIASLLKTVKFND